VNLWRTTSRTGVVRGIETIRFLEKE
jgi:hypothetical protein